MGRGARFGGLAFSPPAAPLSVRMVQLLRSASATLPVSLLHPETQPHRLPSLPIRCAPPSPRSLFPSIGVYFRQETGKEMTPFHREEALTGKCASPPQNGLSI